VTTNDPSTSTASAAVESPLARAAAALRRVASARDPVAPELPYAELLRDPGRWLGPFDALPVGLQDALRALHREDEAQRTLAAGALSTLLAGAGAAGSRPLLTLSRWLARASAPLGPRWRRRVQPVRRTLRTLARQPIQWAYRERRALHQRACRVRGALGAADLRTVLGAQGVDFDRLAHGYLHGLAPLPECRAIGSDRPRHTLYTLLLGVDFVKSGGEYWFLEANVNPTLSDARFALYDDGDPFVDGIFAFTDAHGYRRLAIYGFRPFPLAHARAFEAAGRRRGIAVEVVDDLFSARFDRHRRARVMEPARLADTLVIRARHFDTTSDRMIFLKQRTLEIVERAGANGAAPVPIPVPRRFAFGAEAPAYDAASPWPNLVGKIETLDRGVGVFFYKLPRIAAELAQTVDFIEEYKVPDPVEYRLCRGKRERLQLGRRASKFRSFLLLWPGGVEYLSSIHVVSGLDAPTELPPGPVRDNQIYLATITQGGFYSAVDEHEDAQCRRMASAVGEIVRQWLLKKYADA
jgi:hypothetical protein